MKLPKNPLSSKARAIGSAVVTIAIVCFLVFDTYPLFFGILMCIAAVYFAVMSVLNWRNYLDNN